MKIMKFGKNLSLLLTGILIGSVFAGSIATAAVQKVTGQASTQQIYVDGQRVAMEAYLINDNNYVKLRDVGKAVDFNVYWDGTVQMNSSKSYTGEAPPAAGDLTRNGNVQVTEAQAKQIALTDAGLKEKDVRFLSTEFDREDGVPVYEIEFFHGTTKYEYDISTTTGEILSCSREMKATAAGGNAPAANTAATSSGADAAIDAALAHAGLKRSDVARLEVESDMEKGRRIYEVEFYVGSTEYSYDIDASTYAVISWEKERHS